MICITKNRLLPEKNQIKHRYPSTLHCFVVSLSHCRKHYE